MDVRWDHNKGCWVKACHEIVLENCYINGQLLENFIAGGTMATKLTVNNHANVKLFKDIDRLEFFYNGGNLYMKICGGSLNAVLIQSNYGHRYPGDAVHISDNSECTSVKSAEIVVNQH